MSTPVLQLLAGSNGSGKSTLAEKVLVPRMRLPFVNADVIAADLWPGDRAEQARQALAVSRLAAQERDRLMAARASFITETVFSHPSKVDLVAAARDLGYHVTLHITLVPEDLTVARVADRVAAGGHQVPEEKIRARYERLWELVARARDLADRTLCYDNSSLDKPFRRIAVYEYGQPNGTPIWPTWTPKALL